MSCRGLVQSPAHVALARLRMLALVLGVLFFGASASASVSSSDSVSIPELEHKVDGVGTGL